MRYPMNALVPTCRLSFRDAPSVATPAGEATRWDASQAGAAASLAGAMRASGHTLLVQLGGG